MKRNTEGVRVRWICDSLIKSGNESLERTDL
jgi:hypothetical protein